MRTLTLTALITTMIAGSTQAMQIRHRDAPPSLLGQQVRSAVAQALADARASLAAAGPSMFGVSQSLQRPGRALRQLRGNMAWRGVGPSLRIGPRIFEQNPPVAWNPQDPADSVYRAARQALNRSDYTRASTLFEQIRSRYPRSGYTPDAFYWEAYAKYRLGGSGNLRRAVSLLDEQADRHPDAATRGDGSALLTRVLGELARQGDEDASRRIDVAALGAVAPTSPRSPRQPRVTTGRADGCRDSDDGVQSAALNALLQMDSERAVPILRRVLARRDAGSACLRRRAVFMLSQQETPETGAMLLNVAKTDPDPEVRSQAVFWLSEVEGDAAVEALVSILGTNTDRDLQERAVFALSQHESPRADSALRAYASRTDTPKETREKAVFWLGQSETAENATFLQDLFGRTRDANLKERILFSVSQIDRPESGRWLVSVAKNTSESTEVRKKALFWAGQADALSATDLSGLYATMTNRDLKEHLIFVLAQADGKAALDELIKIARTERDSELQKKAIFWLSQSDDPRVADVLAEFLDVQTRRP